MTNPADHFAAFVSPVEGHLVRRFGTSENIGQLSDEKGHKLPAVDTKLVIPITHEEWRRFGHEYRRAAADGSLRLLKAEDWTAAEAAAEKAAVEADEKRKAAIKAAEDAARAAPNDATPPAPTDTTGKKKGS